jgi:Sulfate permease family/Histidine kinase-, DNA gyrase B-, and HSP90-like ATPase
MPDGSATAHLIVRKLHGTSGGIQPRPLSQGYVSGVNRCNRGSPAVDGRRRRIGRFARAGIICHRHRRLFSIGARRQRYQIGGPAGAFIVLVAATVTKFGLDGLLLTVFISGFMLTLIGLLRLGSLIRYIPHAVTVGFTCGIASRPNVMATIFHTLTHGENEDGKKQPGSTNLGLGLFITNEIVSAHGGRIDVTSSEKNGTTFRHDSPVAVVKIERHVRSLPPRWAVLFR